MERCSYLVRKNRANKLTARDECGQPVVAVYRSAEPDAYGNTVHPRCKRHDTEAAQQYVAKHNDWTREEV